MIKSCLFSGFVINIKCVSYFSLFKIIIDGITKLFRLRLRKAKSKLDLGFKITDLGLMKQINSDPNHRITF